MKSEGQISPINRFWLLLKPYRKEIRQVYLFAIFNGCVLLSLPLGIQSIINFVQAGLVSTSWILLVVFVLIGIALGGVLQIMQLRITENLQQNIFTKSAFEFAFRLPKIKQSTLRGEYLPELMNRFFDTITIQKGLSKILIDFSTAVFQIVLGLLLLAFYHPFFIIISVVLVLLVYVIFKITAQKGMNTSLKESKYKYQVAYWLQEIARTASVFKMSGDFSYHLKKNDLYVQNYLNARENHFLVLRKQYMLMILFKVVVAGLLLTIGGLLVINQQMNVGQFVAAELIILLILGSVEKLILSLEIIYDTLTSLEKLGQVTDLELEDTHTGNNPSFDDQFKIELDQVSYKFPNSVKNAIDKLSLKVHSKEKIILTGCNGSGKSTVLNFIIGLAQPDSGKVTINDLSIDYYDTKNLRSRIGNCITGEVLFNGSILDNITLGNPNVTFDKVIEVANALKITNALKDFPENFNTIIQPDSKNISKNLTHKIILARGIINNPSLLIIDDIVDYIDIRDRDQIIDYLTAADKPWTLIASSTYSYFAKKADKIAVLEEGKLVLFDRYGNVKKYFEFNNS